MADKHSQKRPQHDRPHRGHDHDHHGHGSGEPHQPQKVGSSLLLMSAATRLGAAALAIAVLWAGVLLAMR